MSSDDLTFYHAPQSRSSVSLTLLEELQAPFELKLINIKAGEQRQPDYLAINPLGKVPALAHKGKIITEQVAIFLYLADLFPEAKLAPALTDPTRGEYLRWMVYYAACYEPAMVDKFMKREPAPQSVSVYCDEYSMLETILTPLRSRPYLLGDELSAADILWGSSFAWGLMFDMLPRLPVLTSYVDRICNRASALKVQKQDEIWAAEHQVLADKQQAQPA
ncbi:glutathione S-transferase family protein [Bowmanella sp. Y26]|uniref:glutathione S-transferase family protein n=1 Tax=Bowmanella yangjiangensis TaxID=2811230 RepID=UPI001BDCF288|nr:glutathione S-transferase family protein [Bowmanella yangjiangensis]MBT1062249.1 glutathione S-transferase family protein [Bowmanella yangjiangensis]